MSGTWKHDPTSWRTAPRPKGWKRIRGGILRRDPICVLCHMAASTDADHIGDPNDHSDANLRGLCGPCHRERTSAQAVAVRMRNAAANSRTRMPPKHPGLR